MMKTYSNRAYFVAVLTMFLLTGCTCTKTAHEQDQTAKPASFSFAVAGLSTGHPGWPDREAPDQGSSTVIKRVYKMAPPVVPHNLDDTAINRTTNDCFDCHVDGEELDKGHVATKIPATHYQNPFRKEKSKGTVTGMRYQCLQCHVTQANNKPIRALAH